MRIFQLSSQATVAYLISGFTSAYALNNQDAHSAPVPRQDASMNTTSSPAYSCVLESLLSGTSTLRTPTFSVKPSSPTTTSTGFVPVTMTASTATATGSGAGRNFTSMSYATPSLSKTAGATATTLANGTVVAAGAQLQPEAALWMWAGICIAGMGTMMVLM